MRLIDADKINPMRCPQSIEEMREWIDRQPTAYDVEAVVRELEDKIEHHWERANYCYDNELYIANSEHLGKCEAFRDAIEIVRGERNSLPSYSSMKTGGLDGASNMNPNKDWSKVGEHHD